MTYKIVIPARYASERLPGKPLLDLGGRPMVVRCLEQALASGAQEVVVAVDDPRVAAVVEAAGGRALMTRTTHQSGTDRLAEVADSLGWDDATVVLNLQGDEPLAPPALLDRLATAVGAGLATLATPIRRADELFAEQVVKVILDHSGRALAFSRAPIPWVRGWSGTDPLPAGVPFLRHLGLYAWRVGTLRRVSAAPPSPLELAERLEQLRAMQLGIVVHVEVIDPAPPAGVDTHQDLVRVRGAY